MEREQEEEYEDRVEVEVEVKKGKGKLKSRLATHSSSLIFDFLVSFFSFDNLETPALEDDKKIRRTPFREEARTKSARVFEGNEEDQRRWYSS